VRNEPGVDSFAGTSESNDKYIWVRFLDSEVLKILSLSKAVASATSVV
jgi:hypothetical protein